MASDCPGDNQQATSDVAGRLYEQILVLRCQAGDELAFAELVERYQLRLQYYVRKLIGSDAGYDDLVQDVWLAVFRGLPRLRKPAAFAAWLYRIARDRVFRQFRNRKPQEILHEEAVYAAEEEEEFTLEDVERVHAALDELPPEQREPLVLRFLEEMSYEGIAQVTGVPLGTVRSRIHYGKRALRKRLERMNVYG